MTDAPARHAVLLDRAACKGCTVCITRCPVEAIRVRKGKASIIAERCIDCGECIRACPHKAKRVDADALAAIGGFDFRIALPAPALYAQFKGSHDAGRMEAALRSLGFDAVVEVAEAAEIVAEAVKGQIRAAAAGRGPLISSSCPAVVRLVQVRFPSLIDNLIRVLSPMEVAARLAKRRYFTRDTGGGVGAFFISPCPAKVTASRAPLGHERSAVDGVLSINDLYLPLRAALAAPEAERTGAASDRTSRPRAGGRGLAWGRAEGEAESLEGARVIAADGMDRVIGLLEAIENGALDDVDYVEALACPGGCVGGPLVAENASLARSRLRDLERAREAANVVGRGGAGGEAPALDLSWTGDIFSRPVYQLNADYQVARTMLEDMEAIVASLPGLDCGSCGAPSCRALAEDIVRETAAKTDCIFILRERLRDLTKELLDLEAMEPPSLDK